MCTCIEQIFKCEVRLSSQLRPHKTKLIQSVSSRKIYIAIICTGDANSNIFQLTDDCPVPHSHKYFPKLAQCWDICL